MANYRASLNNRYWFGGGWGGYPNRYRSLIDQWVSAPNEVIAALLTARDGIASVEMSTFEPGPTGDALRDLCQISPFPADGGELIGKHPSEVPLPILSRYHGGNNPLSAIRARCLDCCCGAASEVRKCTAVACPSWPFRMGSNPFRAKRVLSVEQRQAMAERLAKARASA